MVSHLTDHHQADSTLLTKDNGDEVALRHHTGRVRSEVCHIRLLQAGSHQADRAFPQGHQVLLVLALGDMTNVLHNLRTAWQTRCLARDQSDRKKGLQILDP
jgi:hypothetical protein